MRAFAGTDGRSANLGLITDHEPQCVIRWGKVVPMISSGESDYSR